MTIYNTRIIFKNDLNCVESKEMFILINVRRLKFQLIFMILKLISQCLVLFKLNKLTYCLKERILLLIIKLLIIL